MSEFPRVIGADGCPHGYTTEGTAYCGDCWVDLLEANASLRKQNQALVEALEDLAQDCSELAGGGRGKNDEPNYDQPAYEAYAWFSRQIRTLLASETKEPHD